MLKAARVIPWSAGVWHNRPTLESVSDEGFLRATAVEGSDAWQRTSYGFTRDSAHALLVPFKQGTAMEVDLRVGLTEQFDQAGLMLRAGACTWIKAGVEYADGEVRCSAVVTDGGSDWSTAPAPAWAEAVITVRVSWAGDAVTVRAGLVGETPSLVRLAPFRTMLGVSAGPYLCAPSRAGFTAEFRGWRVEPADRALH